MPGFGGSDYRDDAWTTKVFEEFKNVTPRDFDLPDERCVCRHSARNHVAKDQVGCTVYLEDASGWCPCKKFRLPAKPKTLEDFFPVRARMTFDEEV